MQVGALYSSAYCFFSNTAELRSPLAVLELLEFIVAVFGLMTWKAVRGQPFALLQMSFWRVAVLTMSKPTLPPKVLGFQYSGEQIAFPMRPFKENGAPSSIIVSPKMAL